MSHVQTHIVKISLQDALRGRYRRVADQIKGWGGAEKLLAATFCLGVLSAGGQVFSYMRSDAAQNSKAQVDAVSAQVASLAVQFRELKLEIKQGNADTALQSKQRDDAIQQQIRDLTTELRALPRPEAIDELRRRETEHDGRINALTAELDSLKQQMAVVQVQVQSFEKGRDIPLPRGR